MTVCSAECEFSSIQAALNAAPADSTILIGAGTYDENLTVARIVTLRGQGPGEAILRQVTRNARTLSIPKDLTVRLEGLTLAGKPSIYGGGIDNRGRLTLVDCILRDHRQDPNGEIRPTALASRGTLTMDGCTITGNGGWTAVTNQGGAAEIVDSTFESNKGAALGSTGELTMTNCVIRGNNTGSVADSNVGGLSFGDGSPRLVDCLIEDNRGYDAGAIMSEDRLVLEGCTIRNNVSRQAGGILAFGSLTMTNCELSGNTSDIYGGGLRLDGSGLIDKCKIVGNRNGHLGGGIYYHRTLSGDPSVLDIRDSVIRDNEADLGNSFQTAGGGIYAGNGELRLTNCTVTGNVTGYNGGGLRMSDRVNIDGGEISGNTAAEEGGGIYVAQGQLTIADGSGCVITGNSAKTGGGIAIAVNSGATATINDNSVTGNAPNNCTGTNLIPNCQG
jgi:hypothetical protein